MTRAVSLRAFAAALAAAWILAACGGGDPTATPSPPPPTVAPAPDSRAGGDTATAAVPVAEETSAAPTAPGGAIVVTATAAVPGPAVPSLTTGVPASVTPAGTATAPVSTGEPTAPATFAVTPALTATGAPEPTVAATEEPVALPEGFRRFVSRTYPYTIGRPGAWTVQANVSGGSLRLDQFVRRGQPLALVNVGVETLPEGLDLTSEQYLQAAIRQLRQAGATSIRRAGTTTVAGNEAYRLAWQLRDRDRGQLRVTQTAFVEGDRAWIISLITAPGVHNELRPTYEQMLETFQLRDTESG